MERLLFVVEDTFAIRDRGVVLVPGITPVDKEQFCSGDQIELRSTDGSRINVPIGELNLAIPNPLRQVFILLNGLTKEDVPIGTEVWSTD